MEGHFDRDGHRRWYSVHGDLTAEAAPVVVCHGGPGSPHDYLENVPKLLGERAVVLYDQLGCGKSEHLRDADPDFWTPELFERELAGLVEHSGSRSATTCSASPGAGGSRSCTLLSDHRVW